MKTGLPYFRIFSTAMCIAMLGACDGANEAQDSSPAPVDERITLSGLALNGYLANALVWVDSRNNNTLDGFESYAYTDAQGYFSYNPNSGLNYCESGDESLQRFCLQTPLSSGKLVIKAAKGIELLSGESFKSVLTATVLAEDAKANFDDMLALGNKPLGNASAWQSQIDAFQFKLSPLSSLKHYLPSSTNLHSVLTGLGYDIPSNLSDDDIIAKEYIAGLTENDTLAATLFAASTTLGRLVDTVSVNLDKATSSLDFGENGLPISSADTVYEALADSLSASTGQLEARSKKFNSDLARNAGITASDIFPSTDLLSRAIAKLDTMLTQNNANVASVQNSIDIVAVNSQLPILLSNLGNIGVQHFAQVDTSAQVLEQLLTFNHSLTLPTLTAPIAFASTQDANAINTLSAFMREPNNRVTTLLKSASTSFVQERSNTSSLTLNLDLNTLSQNLVTLSKQSNAEAVLASEDVPIVLTELAEVTTPTNNSFWSGKTLSLSGIQDGNEQGQVRVFFNGDENADAGNIVMCVAYKNENDPSENIDGQRFEGTWSLIGSAAQNRLSLVSEGFNIQMKVLGESLGADIPREQQVESLTRISNESYGRFGFTLNEDTATWHSDDASVNQSYGLTYFSDLPNSSEACQELLNL